MYRILILLCVLSINNPIFSQELSSLSSRYQNTDSKEVRNLVSAIESTESIDSLKAQLYYELALTFWYKSDYYEVEWLAKEISKISTILGSPYWEAIHYNILGNIYTRKGLTNEALTHYNEAILRYLKANRNDRVAIVKNNLSVLYTEMGSDSLALEQSLDALKYFSDLNDAYNLSNTHTNLGNVYAALGDTVEALDNYMKALEFDTKNKDTSGISSAYTNIGTIYAESKNHTMAKVFFENALALDSISGDDNALMISYYNIGFNYLNDGKPALALPYFNKSLYKAKLLSSYNYVLKNAKALSLLFEKRGEYQKGVQILRESLSIYDSLYVRERIQELSSIQKSFESKQSKIESELLQATQAKNKASNERQKFISYLFIAGLLIVISVLFLVWRSRNRIQHLNKELRRANSSQNQNSRKILQQKTELEKVNRENKELISILIHDLKNPFAQINLLSESLSDPDIDDARLSEDISLIKKASTAGLNLIERISTAHLIDEGMLNPKFKKVEVCDVVERNISLFLPQANKKEIEIVYGGNRGYTFGTDEGFLENILQNLLSNAIKFSPPKTKVFLSCVKRSWGLEFKLRDEGPGFSASDREELFKKFKRLSAMPTAGENSSGVGLAIAKSLTERLGGSLQLNEDYEEGAEFILRLPRVS